MSRRSLKPKDPGGFKAIGTEPDARKFRTTKTGLVVAADDEAAAEAGAPAPAPTEAQKAAQRDSLAFEWNQRRTTVYIVAYFASTWAIAFLLCFLLTQFLLRVSS